VVEDVPDPKDDAPDGYDTSTSVRAAGPRCCRTRTADRSHIRRSRPRTHRDGYAVLYALMGVHAFTKIYRSHTIGHDPGTEKRQSGIRFILLTACLMAS
jgi:hypothetical protein